MDLKWAAVRSTEAGWDGRAPVLAVCPIHPFWWPVKPSLGKFVAHSAWGAYQASYYRTIYFHKSGPKVDAAFERYISNMARAVAAFRQRHGVFVILVAMEQLDERACRAMAARMDGESTGQTPIFTSEQYDMYEMVSVLRACDMMVSSRYHGMVTTMPALVPSAGVTMDERIRNLLHEQGREDLLMTVDDPDLEEKLLIAMEKLRTDADAIRAAIGRTVVRQSQADVAHGSVHRAKRAGALSGFSHSPRRAQLGRIFAATQSLARASLSKSTRARVRRWRRDERRFSATHRERAQQRGAGDRVTRMVKLHREDATANAAEAVPQEFRA